MASTFVGPGQIPMSGAIPVGVGTASVLRIPVPGTNWLAVELTPRGWTPKGGSTSTLFIQNLTGNRHLRLDYGYNIKTKSIDYHWNQKGAGGAWIGTFIEPGLGTGIGAFGGCIVGGVAGYLAGEKIGGEVYNWADDTFFIPLQPTSAPAASPGR